MSISKGTLVQWRYLAENTSMVSALGEYTPSEFIELLDYVEELEAKVAAQQSMHPTMDKYLQAEYIFNKLNEAGAGLGNASIFIIKGALQDLEAAQQSFAPDEALVCGYDGKNHEYNEAGNMCIKCRQPRR